MSSRSEGVQAVVPLHSLNPRKLPQGSPTALLQSRTRSEGKAHHRTTNDQSVNTSTVTSTFAKRLRELQSQLPTKHKKIAHLGIENRTCEDELILSWNVDDSSDSRTSPHTLRAVRLLQRIGRGYLLRSFNPPTSSAVEQCEASHRRIKLSNDSMAVSFLDESSTSNLHTKLMTYRSIYSLEALGSSTLDEMIGSAKQRRDHTLWRRLCSPTASRLQRSASTLFLEPPPDVHAVAKRSDAELIRINLAKADRAMKTRLNLLVIKTRNAQCQQDLKMLNIAKEESDAAARLKQAETAAREQRRLTRIQHQAEERERDALAVAERSATEREFEIKRAELHVELRQRYMKEDRVTALRTTIAELGHVAHLSATVPSLNLTKAMKEAHFQAEGLGTM